ncbi:MAG: hypothetical protein E2O39_13180 [Planctomycetota bacterium]|nr:MAG: hypothetical protein E2O39_13180 [Planctomycetota bacterium]
MTPPLLPPPAALILAAALALGGCAEEPTITWPPGTVLAVDSMPIFAADVDEWLDTIALVEPAASKPGQRRFALTNIVLHRTVARLLDPARFASVRADAEATRKSLVAGLPLNPGAPPMERISASWQGEGALGLDVWGKARTAPIGEWSAVFESIGTFVLFRVIERPSEPWNGGTIVTLDRVMFPYLVDTFDPRGLIESGIDDMVLTVIDEEWGDVMPEHYKYRMKR